VPCPCGSPFPAIQVRGRAADLLTFRAGGGEPVTLSPVLFGAQLDRVPGIGQYELVQTAPDALCVRLGPADERVWEAVRGGLTRLLAEHGITGAVLDRADEPPRQEPGGKFRRIVPLPG
jgi:phenylacetate-CoA ligase